MTALLVQTERVRAPNPCPLTPKLGLSLLGSTWSYPGHGMSGAQEVEAASREAKLGSFHHESEIVPQQRQFWLKEVRFFYLSSGEYIDRMRKAFCL